MQRKGWVLLAVCVVLALVAAGILYKRSLRAAQAARNVQLQTVAAAPAPIAGPGATQTLQDATTGSAQAGRVVTYIVRRGDTLRAISLRYFGSASKWRAIAKENGIRGSLIRTGMKLHITLVAST